MKPVLAGLVAVVLAAAAIALTGAAVGNAGPSADPKVAALSKKLAKLDARVKVLEKSNSDLRLVAVGVLASLACEAAMTADALQTTWGAVDQFAPPANRFGPQAPLNDQKACSDLDLTRQVAGSPPSVASFQKLIDFVYGP